MKWPCPRGGASAGLRAAARGFRRGTRGSVSIESALAITVLVATFGGLMGIVGNVYSDDTLARAARAAARALALDPTADTCAAIRRELGLAADFDCAASWTLTVDRGVSPARLPSPPNAAVAAGAAGDLVLVRIGPNRAPGDGGRRVRGGGLVPEGDGAVRGGSRVVGGGSATPTPTPTPTPVVRTVPMVGLGIARCEDAGCGTGSG